MTLRSALQAFERPVEREDAVRNCSPAPFDERIENGTAAESPRVAIVIASDDARQALTEALSALNAQVVVHENLRSLRLCLLRDKIDLVIADATLPDANWADVLRLIVRASLATELLVHSSTADEGLRSEVLWRGGRGIVTPPYSIECVDGVASNTLPKFGGARERGTTSRGRGHTRRSLEVAGHSVHLISYKVGESWLCKVDNVSPGAEIANSVSCTQADAELLALSKAERRLSAR